MPIQLRGAVVAALILLPARTPMIHAATSVDPCGEAFSQFETASVQYLASFVLCPDPLCVPLIQQFGERLMSAAVQLTYACAI